MFKSVFTIFLVILVLFSLSAFAGKFKTEKAEKVTPELEQQFLEKLRNIKSFTPAAIQVQGTELGRTWYDYATNTTTGRMSAYALGSTDEQDGIHFAFMKRVPDAGATRIVTYDYYDLNLGFFFGNTSVKGESPATGWGRVANGLNDEALVVHHGGGLHLWQDMGEASFSFDSLFNSPGVFPDIYRSGNYVIFSGNYDDPQDTVLVSSDYMANWTGGDFAALPGGATTGGSSEITPTLNPLNMNQFAYCYAPDTSVTTPNGGTVWALCNDWTATPWTYTQADIQNDNEIFAGNRQYIIENFSQMNYMYTQDGNFHVVYGAVQGVLDTALSSLIDHFPILYWNKDDGQFVKLTDDLHDTPADTNIINQMADGRPGNGLGNAYPTIAEGPNGDLLVVWQQWENVGADSIITVVGTAGNEKFMTDFYGAYSPDGGQTWTAPFFVAGTPEQSDVYPYIPNTFMWNSTGDSIYIDLLYMIDTDPGVSLFANNNNPSECIWVYERVAVAQTPNAIGDEFSSVIDRYSLEQNYPNPFNPTTTIKFYLPKTSQVTLEVFNTLGQKVATVVDEKMKSGKNEIVFDASDYASGIYYYRMSAEDFNMTRKMVLMK